MNHETTTHPTTTTTTAADASTTSTALYTASADEDDTVNHHHHHNMNQILQSRLLAVWPRLLEFPPIITGSLLPLQDNDDGSSGGDIPPPLFDISLIIPAYREASERIVWTLDMALRRCGNDPKRIQVIIVQVVVAASGQDNDDDDDDFNRLQCMLGKAGHTDDATAWGDVTTVRYVNNQDGGGGRGPAQNYGARMARGLLLTFLHADTVIPIHWDRKIYETLLGSYNNGDQPPQRQGRIVQACAFSFGHNTEQLDGMSYPWGINAVWLLGNLRAYFFRLPYGDHVLSIPTTYFRYLGGFPDQPMMEDYDLMDLLRKRAAVMKGEGIRIIPFPTAQCSVRRWQRFGTVYVTLVNALLVHRYSQGGWTADDVYEYYYERPTTMTMTGANNSRNKEKKKQ
jgi:glycosyltransferase involved in cell wall biosynthesis